MNDLDRKDGKPVPGAEASDDPVGTLLRASGRRPPIPPVVTARVRAAVHEHWNTTVRPAARRRWLWTTAALATAASLVGVAVIVIFQGGLFRPLPTMGRVEMVANTAWQTSGDLGNPSRTPLTPGEAVSRGGEIVTGSDGRTALRLETGHSVRLDRETQLRILDGRTLVLDRGAVYVDSVNMLQAATKPIEIRTPFGRVRDTGTQFEVRMIESSLRLRVREGAVSLDGSTEKREVTAGQELTIDGSGLTTLLPLEAAGSEWAWIDGITPLMEIEGRSLQEFLDWMARERGLRLEGEGANAAPGIALSGSIDGMTLDEALTSVLATSGMSYRIEAGVLTVETAAAVGP